MKIIYIVLLYSAVLFPMAHWDTFEYPKERLKVLMEEESCKEAKEAARHIDQRKEYNPPSLKFLAAVSVKNYNPRIIPHDVAEYLESISSCKYSINKKLFGSALLEAAKRNFCEIVPELIALRVNLDYQPYIQRDYSYDGYDPHDEYYENALMCAAQRGHTEFLELLIHNGADLNRKLSINQPGRLTALEMEIRRLTARDRQYKIQERHDLTAIAMAIQEGHEKCFELLLKNGARITIRKNINNDIEFFSYGKLLNLPEHKRKIFEEIVKKYRKISLGGIFYE